MERSSSLDGLNETFSCFYYEALLFSDPFFYVLSLVVLFTMKLLTFGCLAAALAFAACSSDTTSSNTNTTPTNFQAKQGSSYSYTETDTASDKTTTTKTSKDTVVASGLTIDGKSNVIKVLTLDASGKATDSSYYAYESNGDLSRHFINASDAPVPGLVPWITVPFSSQTSGSIGSYDTNITYAGHPAAVHSAYYAAGTGTGSTTVKGSPYSIKNAHLFAVVTISIGGTPVLADTAMDWKYSFSPQLGWSTTIQKPIIQDQLQRQTSGSYSMMTDFKQ
jgi:hypothetical protein